MIRFPSLLVVSEMVIAVLEREFVVSVFLLALTLFMSLRIVPSPAITVAKRLA
jgi:hypothetical protein